MRTVTQAALDGLASPRIISSEFTLRTTRPVWSDRVLDDSLDLSDPSDADACVYSTGIARVVNLSDNLYTQIVSDVTQTDWEAWVSRSIAIQGRPGIEGGYVWYQKANGDICVRSLASWSTETVITSGFAYEVTIAPVSSSKAYIQFIEGDYIAIAEIEAGSVDWWDGRVYGNIQTPRYLDAATLSGVDYIYFSDRNAGRITELTRQGTFWGGTKYVVPIDEVDNTMGLTLAYVTVLDNKIFLTGRMVRTSDGDPVSFDALMVGPKIFSTGRELFITDANVGGKLFQIGTKAYCVGVNKVSSCTATKFFGYDNASMKTTTSDVGSLKISDAENRSTQINLGVSSAITVNNGQECEIRIGYDGEKVLFATTEILEADKSIEENGGGVGQAAMTKASKRLYDWIPDQSLWMPSQPKVNSHPATLEKVIRVNGTFTNENDILELTDLNLDGILYSVGRASPGGITRAKFRYPSGDFTPAFGVGCNYYRESKYEASERLGKNMNDVGDDEHGHNALIAIWQGGTIKVYNWSLSVFTELTSASLSLTAETWYWLQMSFQNGEIRVDYRANDDPIWDNVISYVYTDGSRLPWHRETFGRGVLYMKNVTPNVPNYGFYSDDIIIPVASLTDIPASETVVVDSERITYSGISNDRSGGPFTVSEAAFPEVNPKPSGYPIICSTADGVNPDDYYAGCALIITSSAGAGKAFKIVGYDAIAPQEWIPTGVYTPPDRWQDHIGEVGKGSWQDSNKRVFYVTEDPGSIVGVGSSVSVTPGLYITARAQGGTVATSHSDGTLSVYRDLSVQCDWFDCVGVEVDNSIYDCLAEISGRAGAGTIDATRKIPNSNVLASSWSSATADISRNFICDLTIPTMSENTDVGFVFRSDAAPGGTPRGDGPDIVSGYMITLNRDVSSYNLKFSSSTASVWGLVEKVPLWFTPSGTMRISAQDGCFSVWINGYLVHSFYSGTWTSGEFAGITASYATTLTANFWEIDDFVEDLIIDARTNGNTAIERTISGREVFFSSTSDGRLRFYRTRDNLGALDCLWFAHSIRKIDNIPTRVRIEGLKTVEAADFDAMRAYGNVFSLQKSEFATTEADFDRSVDLALRRSIANAVSHNLVAVPHPAMQCGDRFQFTTPYGTYDIDIVGYAVNLSVTSEEIRFEASIEGVTHA